MKTPIQLFVAIAVLLAAATVTAQVYKWVDKDGKVQYTDTPPPVDAKGTPKKVDTRPASGPAATPATPAAPAKAGPGKDVGKDAAKGAPAKPLTLEERNKESEKRRAEQADVEKKAAEQAKVDKANQERCKDATRYLRDLETGRAISTTDDSGERKILDDAARAAEVTRARNAMSESCK
jgi:hypothetical protein